LFQGALCPTPVRAIKILTIYSIRRTAFDEC
jgi:hypothetical protein